MKSYNFICRLGIGWNFEDKCIPLPFASIFNITRKDAEMNLCKDPKDVFGLYNTYISPLYESEVCHELCEVSKYKGATTKTIPETSPIEVCYWIGTYYVMYSEEYLIYDFKVILGSIGGMMSLLLGFIWNTTLRKLLGTVKALIRK